MWYTGIGSGTRLTARESAILHELGVCLAEAGWQLRTGGRGVVDDVLHQSAEMVGGRVETLIPFSSYRDYNTKNAGVSAFSDFPAQLQEVALANVEASSQQMKILSPLQKNLLASTVPILLGETLDQPSRFVLTWHKMSHQAVSNKPSDDAIFHTQEGPLFYLAQSREIPVFNLSNPVHFKRVSDFIQQHRFASAVVG